MHIAPTHLESRPSSTAGITRDPCYRHQSVLIKTCNHYPKPWCHVSKFYSLEGNMKLPNSRTVSYKNLQGLQFLVSGFQSSSPITIFGFKSTIFSKYLTDSFQEQRSMISKQENIVSSASMASR